MQARCFSLVTFAVLVGLASGCGKSTEALTCDERRSQVQALIDDALSPAASTACQSDLDCTLVPLETRCRFVCDRVAVSTSGADALAGVMSDSDSVCGTGCGEAAYTCHYPLYADCADGLCAAAGLPPAGWVAFSMERGQAACAEVSVTPTCAASCPCALWALTPDGALSITESGVARSAMLAGDDFNTVDTILRSLAFREKAWTCDPAPAADTVVFLVLTYTTGLSTVVVTDCVEGGPAGNDLQRIYAVFSAY